jgi:hypothetical protein
VGQEVVLALTTKRTQESNKDCDFIFNFGSFAARIKRRNGKLLCGGSKVSLREKNGRWKDFDEAEFYQRVLDGKENMSYFTNAFISHWVCIMVKAEVVLALTTKRTQELKPNGSERTNFLFTESVLVDVSRPA